MALSFAVRDIVRLDMVKPPALESYFVLSPFVSPSNHGYRMLVRAVNPSPDSAEKIARIHAATSQDGLRFVVEDRPAIAPGPTQDDRDGCEDPGAAVDAAGWHVYYTGWNQEFDRACVMYASGIDTAHLEKRGVALRDGDPFKNPKEVTVAQGDDGWWNLIFEYASDGKSQIGIARSESVSGPWKVVRGKVLDQRPASWDNWHLSAGPVFRVGNQQVMLYNGASSDPKWRIGWMVFDGDYHSTIARCDEPLIVPPTPQGDDTDIAFAASVVPCDDGVWLYYSVADRYLYRATISWSGEPFRR
jgi:beta-1,2-mannobiose phosphorylase / 1,2-beta-oligomannan phosphorylase